MIKRNSLIYYFRKMGFQGPFSAEKYQFMVKDNLRIRIPDPDKDIVGSKLLMQILKEAQIEGAEWEELEMHLL